MERHVTGIAIVCAVDANTWAVAGEKAVGMLRDTGRQVAIHRVDRHSQPAHALHGEYFCEFSAAVAEEAVNRCIDNAAAIRKNQPEGLTILSEALMRSGISMVIAGSSAPASGGKHLISHLWDMTAHWSGRTPALHGEQTAVTTLISLRL